MKAYLHYTLAVLLALTSFSGLFAQVNFAEDTVIMVLDEGVQNEQALYIVNGSSDTLDYDYNIFFDEFQSTAKFSTQFCDCNACLENYPPSGSCTDLLPGESWPFAVYIVADSLIGGKYFSVSFVNPNNPSDGDTITVMTEVGDTLADIPDDTTGTFSEELNENHLKVQISPNPASDKIYLSYVANNVSIRVFNITGELVLEQFSNNKESADLDVSELQRGVYIVNVSSDAGSVSKRVMIE